MASLLSNIKKQYILSQLTGSHSTRVFSEATEISEAVPIHVIVLHKIYMVTFQHFEVLYVSRFQQ